MRLRPRPEGSEPAKDNQTHQPPDLRKQRAAELIRTPGDHSAGCGFEPHGAHRAVRPEAIVGSSAQRLRLAYRHPNPAPGKEIAEQLMSESLNVV